MMNTITVAALKEKLDNGDDFKLIMTMPPEVFDMMHIPGSLQISDMEVGLQLLNPDDEIVVYCTSPTCAASREVYHALTGQFGFSNVLRFAGGLEAWEAAGFPLEGTQANQ